MLISNNVYPYLDLKESSYQKKFYETTYGLNKGHNLKMKRGQTNKNTPPKKKKRDREKEQKEKKKGKRKAGVCKLNLHRLRSSICPFFGSPRINGRAMFFVNC